MGRMLDQPARILTVAGRKRLELARALATEAETPAARRGDGGPQSRARSCEIVAIIRKIRDSGVTILLIEHVMQAVMSLSEEAMC